MLVYDLKNFSQEMQNQSKTILLDSVKQNLKNVVDMAATSAKDMFHEQINPKHLVKSKTKKLFKNYLTPYWKKYHNPEIIKDLIASFRYKVTVNDKKTAGISLLLIQTA